MIGTTLTIILLVYFFNKCVAGSSCRIYGYDKRQSFDTEGKN